MAAFSSFHVADPNSSANGCEPKMTLQTYTRFVFALDFAKETLHYYCTTIVPNAKYSAGLKLSLRVEGTRDVSSLLHCGHYQGLGLPRTGVHMTLQL